MKRNRISKHIAAYDKWDLEGDIELVILNLRTKLDYLKSEYSEYDTFFFKILYDYNGNLEFEVHGNRDETDEEYNERLEYDKQKSNRAKLAAEIKNKNKKEKELQTYLKLKEKYG